MPNFKRTREDFECQRCGMPVSGDGYTNHCPRCLWGKHVDVDPGDRASTCGGMMEPISIERRHREERIRHRCVVCGFERENRTDGGDDRDAIIALAARTAEREAKGTL